MKSITLHITVALALSMVLATGLAGLTWFWLIPGGGMTAFLVAILVVCAAGFIATLLGRRISHALSELATWAQGDCIQPLPASSYREIAELSRLFTALSARLKADELELQHRIVEHEVELQQRHRKYHTVIQAIDQGFLRLDREGRLMEANPAYVGFSGYSEAELVGMRIADLESQESPEQVVEHIHKILQHGTTTFDTRHRRKDGSDWDVEVNTAFIEDEGDYFIAFIKDISERKRDEQLLKKASLTERRQLGKDLEAITFDLGVHQVQLEMQNQELQQSSMALQQSRDSYADLFDFAPVGYLTLTDKGQITKINLTGAMLLGIDRQEALIYSIGHFLSPEECDHWHLHNSETLKHHNKQSGEFYLQREDGTVFYALLDCQRRDILTTTRVHISFTDITERKQLEQQLRQAQKMEALGQMTGGIAHDFNNILAVILGYSNLALERCVDQPTDKLARYLAEVISASERARDLIAKMLAYSRKSVVLASAPLDMAQEIVKAVAMVSTAIPAGIKVVTSIDPYVRSVRIDPIEVQQLVVNLAINARDAIGEQGLIDIVLKQITLNNSNCAICHMPISGDYVSLEIKDSGPGISVQLQQRIFDPFFTTKDIGKGTGLGLSMVQGLVKKNGGHLLIKSALGLGTVFQLLFPCADKDAEAVTSVTPVSIAIAPMPKHKRIWVIEDNSSLSGYYLELLQEHGYRVTLFTDPAEALHMFKRDPNRADLVFTDQTMPHLSGAELARAMLAIKPELPVVLISGYSDSMNAEAAKQLGIRCYLTKPVDEKKLLHTLARELSIMDNK